MPMDAADAARVLSYPTRAEIYRYIVEAGEPVGVAELRAKLRLSHTAVRQHVAALRAAGLVAEQVERRLTAGRPRVLYRALGATAARASDVPPGPGEGEPEDPYERLATMLADVVRRGLPAEEVGREHGAAAARAVAPDTDPVAALVERLDAMGFSPLAASDDGHQRVTMCRCPWAAVAAVFPETVCSLHRGFVAGFLAALGGPGLDRFSPHEPARAGCEIVLAPRQAAREAR
jgi:predicted ArsR family transcriptional regulator